MNEIVFSNAEFALLNDAEVILRKRLIQDKIYRLLEASKAQLENSLPGHIILKCTTSKISRGENYNGLPYQILDFPALFKQSDILACRTMFLWGRFFSLTIHLQGRYLKQNLEIIPKLVKKMAGPEVFISNADTPWKYTYEPNNYLPISEENIFNALSKDYVKISKKILLAQHASLSNLSEEFYLPFLEELMIDR